MRRLTPAMAAFQLPCWRARSSRDAVSRATCARASSRSPLSRGMSSLRAQLAVAGVYHARLLYRHMISCTAKLQAVGSSARCKVSLCNAG